MLVGVYMEVQTPVEVRGRRQILRSRSYRWLWVALICTLGTELGFLITEPSQPHCFGFYFNSLYCKNFTFLHLEIICRMRPSLKTFKSSVWRMVLLIGMETISLPGAIAKSLHIVSIIHILYNKHYLCLCIYAPSVTKHCSRTSEKLTIFLPQYSVVSTIMMISISWQGGKELAWGWPSGRWYGHDMSPDSLASASLTCVTVTNTN